MTIWRREQDFFSIEKKFIDMTSQQSLFSIKNRTHAFDWEEWEILFDTYLVVEGIRDDSEKRNVLITASGFKPFKTLVSICKPKKPTEYD